MANFVRSWVGNWVAEGVAFKVNDSKYYVLPTLCSNFATNCTKLPTQTCNKIILFALQVLDDYSEELQKKFLLFTTGSDRVPVGGMGEMTFKITKMVTKTPKTKVIY